ncbi:polyketide synthase [Flavobacterium sp. TAB 87]|uniref:polyketide synthase n=1 Tax=Flavobacterium sp. TAB 87 TaxID=1729581 RepID=UPI0018D258C4|nr:polyketide synthase [Flavobacterium sp. TAB 87]
MNNPNTNNSNNKIIGAVMPYPKSTLHELFDVRAKMFPHSIALEFNDIKVSYGELQKKINQMANYLWSQGLRPGQIVAVSLDRSPDLIASLFAILQCGASYVPIDVLYPDVRIHLMIEDSAASFYISSNLKTSLENKIVCFSISEILTAIVNHPTQPLPHKIATDSAAFIIYTSGSTGKPKGVQVAHCNVINLLYSMAQAPGITENDKIFSVTTISFDAMVMEIYLPLLFGACVVLVDEETRRDGQTLLKKAVSDKITIMWGTPSIWQILIDSGWEKPLHLKALIGGEPVPLPLAHKLLSLCSELWNIYGPTETTVCCILTQITINDNTINIGKPIANTQIYLLDTQRMPVNEGEVGEIVIAGDGVSLGYLNKPDLTNERFVHNVFQNDPNRKMYLSGDLGKVLPNGQIQCLGRIDQQVKVSGHRIELGEIESVLNNLQEIKRATVVVSTHIGGEPSLVAYLQSADHRQETKSIRDKLEEILPEFMVPKFFMWVTDFPITTNGKIDTKNLPVPEYIRPSCAPLLRKPTTKLEKEIAKVWSDHLQVPLIGIDDNFFEMGGTSLLTQRVVSVLKERLDLKMSVTTIYQYATIARLCEFLELNKKLNSSLNGTKFTSSIQSGDVAIIGMAGRFPGAQTINELWNVLKEGRETISFFKPEEIDYSIAEELVNDPLYVAARGIIPSANTFDAAFFGINPKLAEVMDPQIRLFLEIAWEALEQTGYLPKYYTGSIGVYAGTGTNTYYKKNILPNKEIVDSIGYLLAETVNEKDYISSRTSYHLNLKGPAVSIHSGCSTSLLAIAEAVQAIRSGQCDIALAGGSSVTAPIFSGHLYQEGSMLSPDGHCRSFDESGKGTVFSDGAGVVLLKKLDAAQKEGDTIYGIIKGIGITNDGGNKGSFTAPSTEGQAVAIKKAIQDAQISSSSISYVETHGTGTPVGDPIELEGLKIGFGKHTKNNFCAIGSIKSNMGHLTAAAGVAGLIKTILAMNHKLIPPSLGFEKPNPIIDFKNSPFYVNSKLSKWESDAPLRAGVSSFGVGGTNVHLVVEEYPIEQKNSSSSRPLQLLMWSAKSEDSLKGYENELGNFLNAAPNLSLADVAYTLNKTRDSFSHRSFILASDCVSASAELLATEKKHSKNLILKVAPNEVVFLFPGQGSQFSKMGWNLYQNEIIYKEAVDTCAEILIEELKVDIRKILYPEIVTPETEAKLKDTRFTQPALFVTEYALSQLWLSWGIKPTALCGHSIGEFVAAHLAGVFSLKDALHLIAIRGRMVGDLPGGSMLSVRLTEDKLKNILPGTLSVAAINSNQLCVVAGEDQHVKQFSQSLDVLEVPNKILLTSHAFHSSMMNPILAIFEAEVKKITLNTPSLPIVSTVTGLYLTDDEAINPQYWSNHLRSTVRFATATTTLLQLENPIFLEVGPGQTLTTLIKQQGNGTVVSGLLSLTQTESQENNYNTILNSLGKLWLRGIEPDWDTFYTDQTRQKLALPSYVFDRKHCWINPINFQARNSITHISTAQNSTSIQNDSKPMRKTTILSKISSIINETSGIEYSTDASLKSFLDLGLDSLTLTQLAISLKKDFKLPITFRQLNEEYSSPSLLAEYLDHNLPEQEYNKTIQTQSVSNSIASTTPIVNTVPIISNNNNNNNNTTLVLIAQQLQLLGKQMELLQVNNTEVVHQKLQHEELHSVIKNTPEDLRTAEERVEHQKPFGASPKIEKKVNEMSYSQKEFLTELISNYTKKTGSSKAYAQKHRSTMADPRVVSGFKPLTKEIVYPIVIEKSKGNRLWDIDGNEYIDALNGFGSCFFGHQPDFIKEALHMQVENGFEVGPQHPLAGEVCELICEFTNQERAALCNTGSEAVLGAMRIARTVTGRSLIVAFSGSYHGIIDEALVRGSKKLMTFPAAPGIMPESVQNMLILEYGTTESLQIIIERADELAAILVEPVQSRRPEFQPIDFLNKVRELTIRADIPLIFDEIITGFRMHPGGAQALFNIQADIATYGKVIGGGLSIGAIAGKRKYMDALDGGHWQYGDDSIPEVGVTYFAGTFVRHPLALAASKAALLHLKKQGPALQKKLNEMTNRLAFELNEEFKNKDLPMIINHFGSLWRLKLNDEVLYGELLFTLLRENGIHIWDGFPCFLTEVYTEEDLIKIIHTFKVCIEKMVAAGFFSSTKSDNSTSIIANEKNCGIINKPPVAGAKLGRDKKGNPAWFVADSNKIGEYVKIDL